MTLAIIIRCVVTRHQARGGSHRGSVVLVVSVATHGHTAVRTSEAGHGAAEEAEVITETSHGQLMSHLGHLTHLSVDNGEESYPCSPGQCLVNYSTISPISFVLSQV